MYILYRQFKAKVDIVCYKVLVNTNENNIASPYYNFKFRLNEEYVDDNFSNIDNMYHFGVPFGFHSYKTLVSCRMNIDTNYHDGKSIFECMIPKGSLYYLLDDECCVGTHPDKTVYISEKIIIKKRVMPCV